MNDLFSNIKELNSVGKTQVLWNIDNTNYYIYYIEHDGIRFYKKILAQQSKDFSHIKLDRLYCLQEVQPEDFLGFLGTLDNDELANTIIYNLERIKAP